MENNFLSGGIEELQQAKTAITEAGELQAAFNAAEAAASAKEKDLESQKKYVADKISSAVKERRATLKKTYDEQVDLATKDLREAERKRKAAKNDAVQHRITSETSDLTGQIDKLKREAKAILKDNRMPGFVNTAYFYSLFAPKRPIDFVVFVITVILAFGVIPNVVCLLLKTDKLIIKILVYLAIVVFFVALYFIFFAVSKRNKKGQAIEDVRKKRTEIRENKKQVKKMSKSIIKDKDESIYGLEGYDSEIAGFQQVVNEKTQKRDEALKFFDEQTTAEITAEIERENQPAIDQLTAELATCKEELESARTKAAETAANVTNSFEIYLGKKNTSAEKVDGLIGLIQEGKAKTIMEALDIQNGEIK